jgi:hypothetical protein
VPDWQTIAVLLALAGALAYLARQALRTWRGKAGGCGGRCKCPPAPSRDVIREDELLGRLRGRR